MTRPMLHGGMRLLASALLMAIYEPSVCADILDDGREAFYNYDFDRASELYARYAEQMKKKPTDDGRRYLDRYRRELAIAESALDNVQKIEVIDRIDVPAGDFFTAIALPRSGGRLLAPGKLPEGFPENNSDFLFSSESGDFLMWTETDENGISHIVESERLLDGSWEAPRRSGEVLNGGGSVRNPFMLTDGVTLYFAADGDASMGGYDLFIASRDSSTGEFLQPTGLGFPFNSPYNEYVMAIDEENGIGWWATDRNELDGMLSLYVFKTDAVRKNYDADDVDDIVAFARLDDISITQQPGADYASLMNKVLTYNQQENVENPADFVFPLPDGRVLTKHSQIPSSARRGMATYLHNENKLRNQETRLEDLRKRYHAESKGKGASQALVKEIKEMENQIETDRESLKLIRNGVVRDIMGR
ncbi:MAG: hypothetical protein K2K93_11415 [Muribaculaceae bacterium]|nr:hypothetical protein [Muribaculaceae bacterium]